MKLIKQIKTDQNNQFYYKNEIIKKIFYNKEIRWYKEYSLHKEDGATIENCFLCKKEYPYNTDRHFYLNNTHILQQNLQK